MYRKAVSLALLIGCVAATPAFAQKPNLPKFGKTVIQNSVQKNASPLFTNKMPRALRAQIWQEAKQSDLLFRKLFTQIRQASRSQHLINMASFCLYNPQYGLIPAMDQFWEELLQDLAIVYEGPDKFVETTHAHISHLITRAPADTQKRLLQKEAQLQYALKHWKEVNSTLQKAASSENGAPSWPQSIAQAVNYTGTSVPGQAFSRYISGKHNVIQALTYTPSAQAAAAQEDLVSLYKEILAWAHGKGKFPFTVEAMAQMLGLDKYAADGHSALYQNLNSPACRNLRAWGWSNEDIRQFIQAYRANATQQYVSRSSLWNKRVMQQNAKNKWNELWHPLVQKEGAATRHLLTDSEKGL